MENVFLIIKLFDLNFLCELFIVRKIFFSFISPPFPKELIGCRLNLVHYFFVAVKNECFCILEIKFNWRWTFQVTPQSPEFIPSKVNSSPNFYSPYASVMSANNITPVKSSTSASNSYAIAPSKGMNDWDGKWKSPFYMKHKKKKNRFLKKNIHVNNLFSAGRNLMRVESPHSVESPKLTPSPPSNVPPNIHQVMCQK